MVLYVKGEKDIFWHYCKNCSKYPEEITDTKTEMPKDKVCPQCYANDQNNDCGGKPSDPPSFDGLV